LLEEAGADVLYRESRLLPHAIDPRLLLELRPWLDATLAARMAP
jgi:hypothetical protein